MTGRISLLPAAVLAAFLSLQAAALAQEAAPGEQADSLKGRFLVASEEMIDPNFSETVLYMLEHDENGALGIAINRRAGTMAFGELLKGLGLEGNPGPGHIVVHSGGPVDPGRGFVLHSMDVVLEDSERLGDGVALTTNPELFRAIAEGEGPAHYIFALGYAGWAPGQLESEIAMGGWIDVDFDAALLFETPDPAKWRRAIDLLKIEL